MRFFRSYDIGSCIYMFLILFYAQQVVAQSILVDEDMSDWDDIAEYTQESMGDIGTGELDIKSVKIHDDDRFIYFLIVLDSEILLQQFNDLSLYIDTDNNKDTGVKLEDIGYELQFNFGDRKGEVYLDGNYTISSYDIGLVSAPTVTSYFFEIKMNKKTEINGIKLFNSDTLAFVFQTQASGGDLVPNNPSSVSYTLKNGKSDFNSFIFLDRETEFDLRFLSYNVYRDYLFDLEGRDSFRRIFQFIEPDIIGLQEVYDNSGEDAASLIQEFLGGQWYSGDVGNDNLLVSRYPIIKQKAIKGNAAYLVKVEDNISFQNVLVIVAHPPCCSNDQGRQDEIDAFMAFLRESKDGGEFDIAKNTPIVIVGDMNLVGLNQQVKTMLTGDIINEIKYGQDFSPDWDGTALEDVKPFNPGMPTTFTWYNENSAFGAGRLDYIVYSGSVLELGTSFSLHSKTLPQEFLDTTYLQRNDTYEASDHLPVVADFRVKKATNSELDSEKSKSVRLLQNYPNPFNSSTTISYTVDKSTYIELIIINSIGQTVSSLVNRVQQSGNYTVNFDASGLSSGIYTYSLRADGLDMSKIMTLVK